MFSVIIEWTKDGDSLSAGSRINVTMATETSFNNYRTQLVFSTVSSSMDSGNYKCAAIIDSGNSLLYVEDSTMVTENTTLIVRGIKFNLHAHFNLHNSCLI